MNEETNLPEPEKTGENEKQWAVGALKPKEVGNREPAFLSQLAKDMATNLIFTHLHIRDFDQSHIGMIFMPIALGCFADCSPEYINDIGLIYEYYHKAGPRSINGYPCFFSLNILSKHDSAIVGEKYEKLRKALEEV
jgi:hypothetical protein